MIWHLPNLLFWDIRCLSSNITLRSAPTSSYNVSCQRTAQHRDVGVLQMLSRSVVLGADLCCMSERALFLVQAGTRVWCSTNGLMLGLKQTEWKCSAPILIEVGNLRVAAWCSFPWLDFQITDTGSLDPSQMCPNRWTHAHTHSEHDLITSFALFCSHSVSAPTSPELISTSADGEVEGGRVVVGRFWRDVCGGCDWNFQGTVSSFLTCSICKTFPTLLPDTDDSPKHSYDW